MCICICTPISVGPAPSDGSGDVADAISGGRKTISAGIARIGGSSLPAAVSDKMEASELLPYVKARPAWMAFCGACLDLPNLSFAFIKNPRSAQTFWEVANGSNGSAIAVGSKELQEAEELHSSLSGWFQQPTTACWQSLEKMHNSKSLSPQQQAHLLLKLADADAFRLQQAKRFDSSIYNSGVRASLALVLSLAGLSDPEKYERMTADPGIQFWQGAIAVAVSLCSPAGTNG
jgi:hypothetical protein